ncbi:helix-turn-helix domain-containing protein [Bradyrhizobium sp.]|uniref:helix-turn-helix domain-containing protein n=1 Tax=Bradyrhizobium sp. TaxID=376 RepID=UPI00262614F3|nr:helix-turn-helix domain-containing protein [Bradyrhizobium sp.]
MNIQFRNARYGETVGKPLHYTACGLDDVYLYNGFTREIIDGEEYITVENLDGLWKSIGLYLVTTKKTLAPKEIRFLRDHMDMTQAQLGALLRVSDQTVARWEKGETVPMTGSADFMLRVLFLGSPIAQPQGRELLQKLKELCEGIIDGDEPMPAPVVFRHNEHSQRWKKASPMRVACG